MGNGLLIAGGALLVGGGLYLWSRKRGAAADDKPPTSSECDKLEGWEKLACQAAGYLGDKLLGKSQEEKRIDDANARNGGGDAIVEEISEAMMLGAPVVTDTGPCRSVGGCGVTTSTIIRYANGCVPYVGHPDYARCAAGTPHLGIDGVDYSHFGDGVAGDPLTRTFDPATDSATYFEQGRTWKAGQSGEAALGAPVGPAPAGKRRLWVKGQPLYCTTVDHRSGAPLCADTFGGGRTTTVPGDTNPTGTGQRGTVTDPAKQGYVWVASPPPGHWERVRAGRVGATNPGGVDVEQGANA